MRRFNTIYNQKQPSCKKCAAAVVKKLRCEIQGGSQEMAVMVV